MKNIPLVLATIAACLLNSVPSWSAEEKSTGSFFARTRKAKAVQKETTQTPAATATQAAAPAPPEKVLVPLGETLNLTEVTISQIKEAGLPEPPRMPGVRGYDLRKEIQTPPTGPALPPVPNKGYLVRRAVVEPSNQELPEAPKRFISAVVAPSAPPESIKESPTQPSAVQPNTAQAPPETPRGLAPAPRALPIIPELKKETALPRSMPAPSVQAPRSAPPKPQVPTPKTPPAPKRRY